MLAWYSVYHRVTRCGGLHWCARWDSIIDRCGLRFSPTLLFFPCAAVCKQYHVFGTTRKPSEVDTSVRASVEVDGEGALKRLRTEQKRNGLNQRGLSSRGYLD